MKQNLMLTPLVLPSIKRCWQDGRPTVGADKTAMDYKRRMAT